MNIYFPHSSGFDFKKEYYRPIKESGIVKEHNVHFPHETEETKNTIEIIEDADVIVAEVSYPSTGLGIELGWASKMKKPVLCVHKEEADVPSVLKFVSTNFIEYSNVDSLVKNLILALRKYN